MRVKTIVRFTLICLFLSIILPSNNVVAQEKQIERKTFRDKIFFGGSIGMIFGTITRVDILPQAGI